MTPAAGSMSPLAGRPPGRVYNIRLAGADQEKVTVSASSAERRRLAAAIVSRETRMQAAASQSTAAQAALDRADAQRVAMRARQRRERLARATAH